MEYIEGPTLAERIRAGPIPLEEALPMARQIAEALEAAHEKGIVHRDLKPSNVALTSTGTVKVLDFGLAKRIDRMAPDASQPPTITVTDARDGVDVENDQVHRLLGQRRVGGQSDLALTVQPCGHAAS